MTEGAVGCQGRGFKSEVVKDSWKEKVGRGQRAVPPAVMDEAFDVQRERW